MLGLTSTYGVHNSNATQSQAVSMAIAISVTPVVQKAINQLVSYIAEKGYALLDHTYERVHTKMREIAKPFSIQETSSSPYAKEIESISAVVLNIFQGLEAIMKEVDTLTTHFPIDPIHPWSNYQHAKVWNVYENKLRLISIQMTKTETTLRENLRIVNVLSERYNEDEVLKKKLDTLYLSIEKCIKIEEAILIQVTFLQRLLQKQTP